MTTQDYSGGFFAQADRAEDDERLRQRRGFVGSASDARAEEAAWRQQLTRKDDEYIATQRRSAGRVW